MRPQFEYLLPNESKKRLLEPSNRLEFQAGEITLDDCVDITSNTGAPAYKLMRNVWDNKLIGSMSLTLANGKELVIPEGYYFDTRALRSQDAESFAGLPNVVIDMRGENMAIVGTEENLLSEVVRRNPSEVVLAPSISQTKLSIANILNAKPKGTLVSERGRDFDYTGPINGGAQIAMATRFKLGACKYGITNEDSVGVNFANGRVVVADGVGGSPFGESASSIAVNKMLKSDVNVISAVNSARRELEFLNLGLKLMTGKVYPFSDASDAVASGIDLLGNDFEAVNSGDCRWLHIRKNRLIAASPRYDSSGRRSSQNGFAEVDLWLDDYRHILHSSVSYPNVLDSYHGGLMSGDRLVMFSDGMGLLTSEIVDIVSSLPPEKALDRLMDITHERNVAEDGFSVTLGNSSFLLQAPHDNFSAVVYQHTDDAYVNGVFGEEKEA